MKDADDSSFVVEVKGSEIVPAGTSCCKKALIDSRELRDRIHDAISPMSIHTLG